MCRRLMFSGVVVLAVSSVILAQGFVPSCGQQTSFIGASGTSAHQSGSLGFDAGTNFTTGQQSESSVCGPCNGTQSTQTNSGYIDQGASAWGCGGSRCATEFMAGGGVQSQSTGYIPAGRGPTCYPISTQTQMIGGGGFNAVYNTCGTGGAAAGQAGAASEFQGINTPSSGGTQYQHLSGSQAGIAYGAPTSFSAAGGTIGGGGVQCQTFGGLR